MSDTDGGEMWCLEVVFAETKEKIGLSYTAITDNEQFHQVIIALLSTHYYTY